MIFRNPLMLAGIAAAALPLVLHLLGRSRARPVDWGATMLLVTRPGGASATARLRHAVLLAVRCVAVALLAIVLAQPALSGAGAIDPNTSVVIVFDASPSLTHPEQNTTRLELARRLVKERLGRLRQGDQAGLVVLGVIPNADVPLTPDLQAVASPVALMTTGVVAADLADGERRAREMLTDAGVDGGEILLVADRQQATWEPLRQTTADIAPGPKIIACPVGSVTNQNAWIESIDLLNPPAVAGTPSRFAVRIRNDGDLPLGNLSLRLSLDPSGGITKPVAVDAHSTTRVVRSLTPDHEGPITVTAAIDHTGLPEDDTMPLAIDVVPPPHVGWIAPLPQSSTESSGRPELALWLDGRGRYVASAVGTDGLAGQAVVILNDFVPDGIGVAAIEQYVAKGGSLILAPGPRVTAAAWNQRLWKNGFGLAPRVSGTAHPPLPPRPVDLPAFADPSIDITDWTAVGVRRYWQLAPVGVEKVLGRLDASPMAIERTFGRGRVVAVAMPLDGQWSEQPSADVYDGLIDSLVRHLLETPVDRNVEIGVPFEMTLPQGRDRNVSILRPDNRFDRTSLNNVGGQLLFRYTRTDFPGRYVIRIADLPVADWYVRSDPSESDLVLLNDEQLGGILRSAGIERYDAQPVTRRETDWGVIGLAMLAVLLVVDVMLAGGFLPRRGPHE